MNRLVLCACGLILSLMSLPISVDAQAQSCSLDLNVMHYQAQSGEMTPIEGATAKATNAATKKGVKAVFVEGMPRFSNLREGKYDIVVTKANYKTTIKQINVDCSGLEADDSVSENIFLFKGNPKEIHKRASGAITVIGEKDEPSAGRGVKIDDTKAFPKISDDDVINSKATGLVKPKYPAAARAVNASGAVNVQVTIDELGNVVSAAAVSGHPLLRAAAVQAARESKFSPTILEDEPVKIIGIIVYNFTP